MTMKQTGNRLGRVQRFLAHLPGSPDLYFTIRSSRTALVRLLRKQIVTMERSAPKDLAHTQSAPLTQLSARRTMLPPAAPQTGRATRCVTSLAHMKAAAIRICVRLPWNCKALR